jgi:hypothetical protein
MEEIVVGIVVGIISSLLASSIFLVVLYRIKPNILISSKISKYKNNQGKATYQIKIANFTSRRVVDVNFSLYRVDKKLASDASGQSGEIKWLKEIPLQSESKRIPELSAFNPCANRNASNSTDYACRIETYEDIELQWSEYSYLRFVVYATDSLSGLNRVFSKDYVFKEESLLRRQFKTGDLLEVWTNEEKLRRFFSGNTRPGFALRLKHFFLCHGR